MTAVHPMPAVYTMTSLRASALDVESVGAVAVDAMKDITDSSVRTAL